MPISALKSVVRLLAIQPKSKDVFAVTKRTYKGIRTTLRTSKVTDYHQILGYLGWLPLPLRSRIFPRIITDQEIIIDEKKLQLGLNEPRRIPYASGWDLFKGSFFGRDSARIAQDRLKYDPDFAKDVILSLASLQGTKWNTLSEEEPGKIHHEWRSHIINGELVSEKQQSIIAQIGPVMGGNEKMFTSYVSADATLAFLETIHMYLAYTGDASLLSIEYYDKDAISKEDTLHRHTLSYAVEKATQWVADTVEYGPLLHNRSKQPVSGKVPRLFSWQHMNDKGVHNQTLRDSEESEFHPNGEKANYNAPRVDTGMQGIAYDVLKKGGELFGRNDWKNLSKKLQTGVLEYLWMRDRQYFAQGLDYHPTKKKIRQIKTLCASVGELLHSDILIDLPPRSSQRYIKGVVKMLFSTEFLTSYGIRTQGVGHIDALRVTMPDGKIARMSGYHGPETVWPVINGKICDGLEHVGLFGLAENIKTRIRNTFQLIGYHAEFINVGINGQLGLEKHPTKWGITDQTYEFHSTNVPELIQGWSWSLHEKVQYEAKRKKQNTNPFSWQFELESELMRNDNLKPLRFFWEIRKVRSQTRVAPINIEYGRLIQQQLFEKWNIHSQHQIYQ